MTFSLRTLVPHAVSASIRRPWVTVAVAVFVAALALVFIAGHFTMTTDTAQLISPNVGWRQHERAMDDAFPQLRDAMLVVVDGATPELAEDGAAKLAATMSADGKHFRVVRRPDGGEFLSREGLLFGSTDEVKGTTAALIQAQPLLGPLAADPSLRGVAAAMTTMLDGVDNGSATLARIDRPIRTLAGATERSLDGKPAFFSWQRLFAGSGSGAAAPTRRLILARPVLDYGSITPGEDAGKAVHEAARALHLDAAHGVDVRLTGDVPLSDEEFSTL
nr:hopanoid biosynthesis-associated RND transporter HpnN [Pseudomonadota bacterium]